MIRHHRIGFISLVCIPFSLFAAGCAFSPDEEPSEAESIEVSAERATSVTVVQVESGDKTSYVLKSDGTLYAAGANTYGQLGNDTTTDLRSLRQVLTGVKTVSAGKEHVLALKTDGTLWATGRNHQGQLGNDTTTNLKAFARVLTGVSAIAAGRAHSLAMKTDGTLWVAGDNAYGQLGDNTNTDVKAFKKVLINNNASLKVKSIAAGGFHSLALTTDGKLWTTGRNNSAFEIDMSDCNPDADPIADPRNAFVCDVAPGGQLGDGTANNRKVFTNVASGVAGISAGDYHSLLLTTTGVLKGAGFNFGGALGIRNTLPPGYSMGYVTTSYYSFTTLMSGVASMDAEGDSSVVVKTDNKYWFTGANSSGQLGNGALTDVAVFAGGTRTDIKRLEVGYGHTLALMADGRVFATGDNSKGQLANGSTTSRRSFAAVTVP
jgi:alpha-tubulin suppressor-like RCC1 family protein